MKQAVGTLYVVGTPIGNLGDLSSRARDVLRVVELIACEDTRRTRGLLSSIGVSTRLTAYHEHNEVEVTPKLLKHLERGRSVALVCDAGTPLISDPGLELVRSAQACEIRVTTIPGPNAAVAGLSIAGLATNRFVFEGFLPRKQGPRQAVLETLRFEPRTMVFYESVHRLKSTLQALGQVFGELRPAVLVREITKIHESLYRGSLGDLFGRLNRDIPLKGEFVVLVAGVLKQRSADEAEAEKIFRLLVQQVSASVAVELTAAITGLSRNAVYRITRLRQANPKHPHPKG
ncbi:MAG: 16S rRNA (cytidine(1402)-2'-O)-methyltransferase [Gammaproteobacteria bacterium]